MGFYCRLAWSALVSRALSFSSSYAISPLEHFSLPSSSSSFNSNHFRIFVRSFDCCTAGLYCSLWYITDKANLRQNPKCLAHAENKSVLHSCIVNIQYFFWNYKIINENKYVFHSFWTISWGVRSQLRHLDPLNHHSPLISPSLPPLSQFHSRFDVSPQQLSLMPVNVLSFCLSACTATKNDTAEYSKSLSVSRALPRYIFSSQT